MYCSACGSPITAGLKFCNRCGASLNKDADEVKGGNIAGGLLTSVVMVALFGVGSAQKARTSGTRPAALSACANVCAGVARGAPARFRTNAERYRRDHKNAGSFAERDSAVAGNQPQMNTDIAAIRDDQQECEWPGVACRKKSD